MKFIFTVAIILFAYQLTVNTRNRRKMKYLRNKVSELEQTLEMVLLYGKAKRQGSKEEAFKEEEGLINQQHTGEPPATT